MARAIIRAPLVWGAAIIGPFLIAYFILSLKPEGWILFLLIAVGVILGWDWPEGWVVSGIWIPIANLAWHVLLRQQSPWPEDCMRFFSGLESFFCIGPIAWASGKVRRRRERLREIAGEREALLCQE